MNSGDINAIYNSWDEKGQNMTRAEFHRQMQRLTDPKLMADEAHDIARGEIARKQIDKKI